MCYQFLNEQILIETNISNSLDWVEIKPITFRLPDDTSTNELISYHADGLGLASDLKYLTTYQHDITRSMHHVV